MYTAMRSIFEDKNNQEKLFFEGPGKDLEVRCSPCCSGDSQLLAADLRSVVQGMVEAEAML